LADKFNVADVGGSMTIHVFGAYFGIAASYILGLREKNKQKSRDDNVQTYNQNILALIGTLILFIFWPSFVGALAKGSARNRAVVNCVLSISSSAFVTFIFSRLFHDGHFNITEIQNATLAGGVAIGATCNYALGPGNALIIGSVAGLFSTFFFFKVQNWMEKHLHIEDTCGVHNLHGIPGIIGGLASIFAVLALDTKDYGSKEGLWEVFEDLSKG